MSSDQDFQAYLPKIKGLPFTLPNPIDGLSLGYAHAGERAQMMTRGLLTSNEPLFYQCMDNLAGILLNQQNIFLDDVYQFLAILHFDLTGEIYLNVLPISVNVIPKRAVQAGEIFTKEDMADIRRLDFVGVEIKPDDRVFCLLKVGWKFGFFFDVGRHFAESAQLDIDEMSKSLGDLYRYLEFEHVYKTLQSTAQFDLILEDGWFPFIEIAAHDFKLLAEIYETGKDKEERIARFTERFDKKRIERITSKWWDNHLFKEKQTILQAGINAYLRDDQEGTILCLKTLLSELEGILHFLYLKDRGQDVRSTLPLIENLANNAQRKFENEYGLGLPKHFIEYLQKVIFSGFDLAVEAPKLSRHSSSHGVAPAEVYTRARALQVILALDQITFYLENS